jgi:hypothetical protein
MKGISVAKKRSAGKVRCLSCDRKAKRRATGLCTRCRAGAPASAAKSFAASVNKSAGGNVVPITKVRWGPRCWNGHAAGRKSDKFCASCAQPYGLTWQQNNQWQFEQIDKAARAQKAALSRTDSALKSLTAGRLQDLLGKIRSSASPVEREAWWAEISKLDKLGGAS